MAVEQRRPVQRGQKNRAASRWPASGAARHGRRRQRAKLEAAPVNRHDVSRVHSVPHRDDDNLDLDLKLGLRVQSGTDYGFCRNKN
ncbi:unnamed protein product [Urochloa humidicola]